jgi:hypothetical protein
LALAHREFGGAGHVVKGVGRHGVVVCVVGAGRVSKRWEWGEVKGEHTH